MTAHVRSIDLPTGVRLEYAEQGDPAGVPLLLLHGFSDSWRSFERVLPHLPHAIRAIAPSMRGHGDSSRPETGYRYADFAGDLAGFMDALDLDAAVVAGHSFGGAIAQRLSIDRPDRVLGLVLISAFASLARNPAPQELREALADAEDPVGPDFIRAFQASTLAKPVPEVFFEMIVQESCKLPLRVWKAVLEGNIREDFSADLDRIRAPTLLVWGDRDEIVPRSDQDEMLAAIAGSRLLVHDAAGHGLHWEEPGRFASDLHEFIEMLGLVQAAAER
jgi:non-heme chloroperoxidase